MIFKNQDNDYLLILGIIAMLSLLVTCTGCTDLSEEIILEDITHVTEDADTIETIINTSQWFRFSGRVNDTIDVRLDTITGGIDSLIVSNYTVLDTGIIHRNMFTVQIDTKDTIFISNYVAEYWRAIYTEWRWKYLITDTDTTELPLEVFESIKLIKLE